MKNICADLTAEQSELDGFVADLDEVGWNIRTPAGGWTIKDQIRHLAYYEERERLAASDPEVFKQWMYIAQAYAGDPRQGRKQGRVLKRKQ